jgi:hypothetical protein
MSYVNKCPHCSLEHVFIGSLVAELCCCLHFSLIKPEQKSLFLQHWELSTQCVAALVSWKHYKDNVSEVLTLMG